MNKRNFLFLALTLLVIECTFAQSQPPAEASFDLGDVAPGFMGVDQHGDTLILEEILQENQVLLLFYRGTWCPYCMQHLKELQEQLNRIQKADAKVVVVTPEQPRYVKQTIEKTDATFSIISDTDFAIMKVYGVAFDRSPEGNDMLPVPATFIIKPDGKISYIHFDPDYKERSDLYEVIRKLKKD